MTYLQNWKATGFSRKFYRVKIISEYDQEIPQSQTADKPDKPMTQRGRATQQSRDNRKTN